MKPQWVAAVKCLYDQKVLRFATSTQCIAGYPQTFTEFVIGFYADCKCGETLSFLVGISLPSGTFSHVNSRDCQ